MHIQDMSGAVSLRGHLSSSWQHHAGTCGLHCRISQEICCLALWCSRFANELVSSYHAPATAANNANSSSNALAPAVGDPLADPAVLSVKAAVEARRAAVRALVLPLLIGMVHTSSSTRAKLWASNGLDLFLQLMATEVGCWYRTAASPTCNGWVCSCHSLEP